MVNILEKTFYFSQLCFLHLFIAIRIQYQRMHCGGIKMDNVLITVSPVISAVLGFRIFCPVFQGTMAKVNIRDAAPHSFLLTLSRPTVMNLSVREETTDSSLCCFCLLHSGAGQTLARDSAGISAHVTRFFISALYNDKSLDGTLTLPAKGQDLGGLQ